MHFERIKEWLTAKTAKEIRIRILLAILGLILTPIGIAVGAFVIFIIARVVTRDSSDPRMDVKCFWFALITIPVLFLLNLLMPRQTKDVYYHDDPDLSLTGQYMTRQKTKLKVMLWLLLTGPRLVDWVIFSFRRMLQLKRQDTHSCAAVLFVLFTKSKRVSYADIQAELDWLNLEQTLPQLTWLEGLLFVTTAQQPALNLNEDLRAEIRQVLLGTEQPFKAH
jgi:hypothetical protein